MVIIKTLKAVLEKIFEKKCTDFEIDSITTSIENIIENEKCIPLKSFRGNVEWVCIRDILYFHTPKGTTYIRTLDMEYEHKNKDFQVTPLLVEFNFFEYMDRGDLYVNFNKIKKYDSYMGKVYFTDRENNKEFDEIFTRVSQRGIVKIVKTLGKEMDMHKDKACYRENLNKI